MAQTRKHCQARIPLPPPTFAKRSLRSRYGWQARVQRALSKVSIVARSAKVDVHQFLDRPSQTANQRSSYASMNPTIDVMNCGGMGAPTAIAVKWVRPGRTTLWKIRSSRHMRWVLA